MNKKEAIRIIQESARLYQKNLVNRNLIFIYLENGKYNYLEAMFLRTNFLHLTGVELSEGINSNRFYDKCLSNNLSDNDFEFKTDGTTRMKLEVIQQLMCINRSANMVGHYKGGKPTLETDKLAGGVNGCLAFIESKESPEIYVPNSALKDDIRNISDTPIGVVKCVFSKGVKTAKYDYLEKCSDYDVPDQKMVKIIENKVDLINLKSGFVLPEFLLLLKMKVTKK